MTQPIGHPGIFLNEYSISNQGHLDLPNILAMGKKADPRDFGVLDLWAYKRREEVPFMALNLTGNIENIETDEYTFDVLTAGDKSIKIVKDLSGVARPGYGGMPFEIITNRYIGAGARIKFDVTHPLEMQAQDNSVHIGGEHHKVTLKIVPNAANVEFVDKGLLVEGSQLTVLAHTINSEFGQKFATWQVDGSSRKKFLNKVTTAEIQTSYHITRQAGIFAGKLLLDAERVKLTRDKVMEYVEVEGAAENGITYLSDYFRAGAPSFQRFGFRGIVSLYDDIALGILAKEAYNYQIWGTGGLNGQDGFDQQHFAPGVYFQLDFSGYKHFYNIETFDISILKGAVRDYFKDKQAPVAEGSEPTIEIRTGEGGFELITEAFSRELFGKGIQIMATDFGGFISGNVASGLSLNQPIVTGYRIPGVALFRVVKDFSLSRRESNHLINPTLSTGYTLSSYTMLIQDYNYASSNMKVVRPINDGGGQIRMNVQNGRHMSHPLFEQQARGNVTVTQSSDYRTGFEATFTTVPDTVIVMDPTRLLKLVPKNPFFSNYGL